MSYLVAVRKSIREMWNNKIFSMSTIFPVICCMVIAQLPPVISENYNTTPQHMHKVAHVGLSTTINCLYTSTNREYVFTWKKDGETLIQPDPSKSITLNDSDRMYTIQEQESNVTATLTIMNVSAKDNGKYSCLKEFKFQGKAEVCNWEIIVPVPVTAVWKPPSKSMTSILAERYTYVNITCITDGNPMPSLLLQRYNHSIDMWVNTSLKPELVLQEGTLTTWNVLYNITSNIYEKLRCFAFNNFTSNEDDDGFLVDTQIPVTFEIVLETHTEGRNESINCATYGYPVPNVVLQRKLFGKWTTMTDVLPVLKNASKYKRHLTWEFYLTSNDDEKEKKYRCRANNTFQYFVNSEAVTIYFQSTDTFFKVHLHAIVSVLVGVAVIISVLAVALLQIW
ncbi:uncharacterized protein [Apostichopus japonicus]|uniref:uncharacterized protein isoform X2 n=1 Tax=Stichopus japonicus TaxID=307972 RepID=UPI003AB33140